MSKANSLVVPVQLVLVISYEILVIKFLRFVTIHKIHKGKSQNIRDRGKKGQNIRDKGK